MKETTFIKRNESRWARYEELKAKKSNDPEELSELFVKISEDFSYSRTFYPYRTVRHYLNNVSQQLFRWINQGKSLSFRSMFGFFKEEIPTVMYQSRKSLLLSFIVFSVSVLIGVLATVDDVEFARTVLGDSYINQTEQNIADGNPTAIYGDEGEMVTFSYIFLNNLRVSMMMFALGIFFSAGTHLFLISNGIMLGAFQTFFFMKGVGIESALAIWIHGAVEILYLIIAGAAGLTLGNGVLFPKTLSRGQSILYAGRRGAKIMVALLPLILFAAFMEGFITRHVEVNNFLRASLIIIEAAFMVFYFVIWPRKVVEKNGQYEEEIVEPRYRLIPSFNVYQIKKPFEMIPDAFAFYGHFLKRFLKPIMWVILPAWALVIALRILGVYSWYDDLGVMYMNPNIFVNLIGFGEQNEVIFALQLLSISAVVYWSFRQIVNIAESQIKHQVNVESGWKKEIARYMVVLIWVAIFYGIYYFSEGYYYWLILLFLPVLSHVVFPMIYSTKGFFAGMKEGFRLGFHSYFGTMVSGIVMTLILGVMGFVVFWWGYILISIGTNSFEKVGSVQSELVLDLILMLGGIVLALMSGVYTLLFALSYFSDREKYNAYGLGEQVANFGKRQSYFETDDEGVY